MRSEQFSILSVQTEIAFPEFEKLVFSFSKTLHISIINDFIHTNTTLKGPINPHSSQREN